MEIVSTSVSTVRLHLSGSQLLLESIQPNQVQVQIDLSTATAGYNVFPINAASITLPPGILLTKVEPRAVEMEIDTYLTLTFPVQVDWAGKLDENLILTSATTIPETVRLRGNSRALNQIDTIYTEKARLEPIRQSGTVSLGLAISHLPVAVASGSADTLQVAYTVTPRTPPDAEATADQ
jgi:YbbR domain-containing protein